MYRDQVHTRAISSELAQENYLIYLTGESLRIHRALKPAQPFQQWHHDWIEAWFKYPSRPMGTMYMAYHMGYFRGDQFNAPPEALKTLIDWSQSGLSAAEYLEIHDTINAMFTDGKFSEIKSETLNWFNITPNGLGYGKGTLNSAQWHNYPLLRQIYLPDRAIMHIVRERD